MAITIIVKKAARRGILRDARGKVVERIASYGLMTCGEVEKELVESAREKGIPQTDKTIQIDVER